MTKIKLVTIIAGIVILVFTLIWNALEPVVIVDGIKLKERKLIAAATTSGLIPKNLIIKNKSTVSANYITYDKIHKNYTCSKNKQEVKDLLYNSVKNLNIAQAKKDEVKNLDLNKIEETERYFEVKTIDNTYRVHNCSFLQLNTKDQATYSLKYNVKPITKEKVKDIAFYLWALHHFGFPHYVFDNAHEDEKYFYHTIYFVEPHTFAGSDLGGCDYVELIKKTISVDKINGYIDSQLEYPQISVKTGKCHNSH